jgi:DNA-binding NarL/FixJ family response regulator
MLQPENPVRIVVADDHPIFCDGLSKLLALEKDFDVVAHARNGSEALEAVQRLEPDILLLDLKMPGLDGLTTLQRMQAASSPTKVIVLTASEDYNELAQAMKFGTSGIVLKQTVTELLIKSIRKVHAGENWFDSQTIAAVMREMKLSNPATVLHSERPVPPHAVFDHEAPPLSRREREIVVLVARGLRNKDMAEKMFISEQTVKNHLHNIFDKLGVSDRLELALYAIHKNLHTQ